MTVHRIFLYPLWVRIWHMLNALSCLMLLLTGISMQYSSANALIFSFRWAVKVHNIFGVILSLSYLLFFVGNLVSPNGKYYKLHWKGLLSRLFKQARYYTFGIFTGERAPFPVTKARKFNPLQLVTYVVIMYAGIPVMIITGWLMLYPESVLPLFSGINGIFITAVVHSIFGFFVLLFMVIHLYFCTIGYKPYSNFKSIVNGWHEAH